MNDGEDGDEDKNMAELMKPFVRPSRPTIIRVIRDIPVSRRGKCHPPSRSKDCSQEIASTAWYTAPFDAKGYRNCTPSRR